MTEETLFSGNYKCNASHLQRRGPYLQSTCIVTSLPAENVHAATLDTDKEVLVLLAPSQNTGPTFGSETEKRRDVMGLSCTGCLLLVVGTWGGGVLAPVPIRGE